MASQVKETAAAATAATNENTKVEDKPVDTTTSNNENKENEQDKEEGDNEPGNESAPSKKSSPHTYHSCFTYFTMAAQLYKTASGRLFHAGAVAIITVGLPARGKTHVSRSLCRYLRWLGVPTRVFSVGNYRRERMGSIPNDWFDPSNIDAINAREKIAEDCLDDMINWLHDGGQVGIYDGNNVTEARRREIHDKLLSHDVTPLFIESICTKPEIVYANIRSVKISSPDYVGWDPEEAVQDYKHRIERLEKNYETISDTTLPFVKLLNVGEQIIMNGVMGYLQSRIVYYLMNLHIRPRKIYFARTGRTFNEATAYKEDPELSPEGFEYAEKLKNFVMAYRAQNSTPEDKDRPLTVWTSTRRKARQTAEPFLESGIAVRHHSVLTQLNPGEVDGMTPAEIKAKFPEEVKRARQDPYRHRFPRAESYHDLAVRLEAIIMELEREKHDVLIIGHETVLKCLYAYLFDRPDSDIPTISVPRSFLIEITPSAYGCKETRMEITS